MTQRGVSSAAIIDSVACAVKLVVEEVFDIQNFLGIDTDWANVRQVDHILRDGPGEDSLLQAVN